MHPTLNITAVSHTIGDTVIEVGLRPKRAGDGNFISLAGGISQGVSAGYSSGLLFGAASRAKLWDASQGYQATDLNAFLPAGFVGAQALSVDSQGNICGFTAKADGTRHAVVWVLNPAQ